MGSCCSDQNIQNQFDNHNARVTNLYQETDAQTEEIKKQTPANVTAAQVEYIISDEKREEQENKQEINKIAFKKELKSLKYALDHASNLKNIIYKNGKSLTNSINEIEYIINLFNPYFLIPEELKQIKSDLIGLYGDMQMFRSFHLRFNLDQSFFQHQNTINELYAYLKNITQSGQNQLNFNILQVLVDNQEFIQKYNETKKLRQDLNQIHGTNFCTLPNYLFCTFWDKQGFQLWVQLFSNEFEVSNVYFCQQYAQFTGIQEQKLLQIIKLLDVSNDQRIDIYQYVQFVENYKDYLDEQGLINNVKIDQFEKHIQAQLKNILKIPIQNEDGSYKLASGAIYEGKLDENYGKVGKGKLKDKDYEFEGEFQNDLPSGNGKEIRKQVVYEGSFQKGLYDGFGKLSFPNGRVYEGNFKNHQFHGKGELINDDGVRYKGDWENGCLLIGVISYHDGSYYTGSLKGNFFKDGKGTLYNKESMPQYEGLWENDQPKICKVFNIFDNHHIFYDGEMENYAITGKGERFYPDGKYQGQLQRDRKEGKGNMLYSDGAKFEGFWENDLQTKGKYIYNLKNPQFFYDGQWKNGIQEGEGEYKYPSGGIYKGHTKANKRHGFGTYLYSNGNKYVGIWDNNNQQGDGQFYFASENNEHGDVYSGQFEQGKFNGFGNYFYKKSGKQYIGYWENDKWNGIGIFRNKDGKIIKCGEWKSDKFIKDVDEKDVVFPADWENKYKIISDIGEQLQNPQDQDQQ